VRVFRTHDRSILHFQLQITTQIATLKAEIAKAIQEFDNTRATYKMDHQGMSSIVAKPVGLTKQEAEAIQGLWESVKMHKDKEAEWAQERETYNECIYNFQGSLTIILRVLAQMEGQMKELKVIFEPMKVQMPQMQKANDFGSASVRGAMLESPSLARASTQ
jgi:hypothetical protein